MTDVGPGAYWGSDYLLQAQKLYKQGDSKRVRQGGTGHRVDADELASVHGRRGLSSQWASPTGWR